MDDVTMDVLSEGEGDTAYDPFRRTDGYGDIGTARLPIFRRLLQMIRALILLPTRSILLFFAVLNMWLVGLLCDALPVLKGSLLPAAIRLNARFAMLATGVLWINHQSIPDPDNDVVKRSQMPIVISNHLGWMDILVVQWLYAASYVTRIETRKTPFIGRICDALPCIYVDRNKSNPQNAAAQSTSAKVVEYALAKQANPSSAARPLCLFPEGTTTNGRYLLPFRTGAFLPGLPVKPLLLQFPERRGNPSLAWETVTPLRHLFLVMTSLYFTVRLVELPMYSPNADERNDPRLFADNVRSYMNDWSHKLEIPLEFSESTFETKKEYHERVRRRLGLLNNNKPPEAGQAGVEATTGAADAEERDES